MSHESSGATVDQHARRKRRPWYRRIPLSRHAPPPPVRDLGEVEADVERVLERGLRRMYFPRRLEELFEYETGVARSRHLVIVGAVILVAYAMLGLTDRATMPEILETAVLVRYGVVTPVSIAALVLIWSGVSAVTRELAITAVIIASVVSVVVLPSMAETADLALIGRALPIFVLYVTLVARLRFWYAVITCAAILASQIGIPQLFDAPTPGSVPLVATIIAFTLIAVYELEREVRLRYLQTVANRIQGQKLMRLKDKLARVSKLDPLTGVPDRRVLDEQLERLCADRQRFSIVLIDPDSLATYNEHYGHRAGDDCLRRVAGILRAMVPHGGDNVARLGAEVFAVLLPGRNAGEACMIAERMRRAVLDLQIPHAASRTTDIVSVSAGVASAEPGATPTTVLTAAHAALSHAKSGGRNRVFCPGDTEPRLDSASSARSTA